MNEPRLRFNEFKDEWKKTKLDKLTDVKDGTHSSPKYKQDGYPLITSKNLKDNYIDINNVSYISKNDFDSINKRSKVDNGDIIFGMIGTIGKPIIVHNADFAIKNVALIKNKNSFNNYFLVNILKSFIFDKYLYSHNDGGTQKFISLKQIREFYFMIPKSHEQQKIGSFFEKLDRLIQLQSDKLEHLKLTKKGYLQKMFPNQNNNQLKFKNFSNNWNEFKLGEIFELVTDYVSNGSFKSIRNNVHSYTNENYAYLIRLQDASNRWKGPWLYTDEMGDNFLKKSRLFPNDIIMSNVGSVGKFFRVPQLDKPMTLAPNAVLLRSSSNSNNFLYWLLNTNEVKNKVISMSTPGVQHKINKTDFKSINVSIPEIKEQQNISKLFDNIDQQINLQQQKLDNLKQQKKAYLQKMFI